MFGCGVNYSLLRKPSYFARGMLLNNKNVTLTDKNKLYLHYPLFTRLEVNFGNGIYELPL